MYQRHAQIIIIVSLLVWIILKHKLNEKYVERSNENEDVLIVAENMIPYMTKKLEDYQEIPDTYMTHGNENYIKFVRKTKIKKHI